MPNVEVNLDDIGKLVGRKFSLDEFREAVLYAKGEVDSAQRKGGIGTVGSDIVVDIKDTNRPDLLSAEGIARELKGRYGKPGLPRYALKKSGAKLIVDASVKGIRPCIAAAAVRDARITDEFIRQMVQLQEKVCLTFGRKRKEAAIGLYDFGVMKPPVYYRAAKPGEIKFVPLDFKREMNLDEILEVHPKGIEYRHLLEGNKRYPILIDSAGVVASMPPIINSEATGKVSGKTKNLFVEVTGMNQGIVNTALNVMVYALAERGAKIESVEVKYGSRKLITPDFKAGRIEVGLAEIRRLSGLDLGNKEIVDLLRKARYDAKIKGKKVYCEYPAYRQDILHAVDVVEDVLVSYGYWGVIPEEVKVATKGSELPEARSLENVREVCIGLGLQEVLTFTLSSREKQEKMMNLKKQEFVEIANPVSVSWSVFRKSVIPELLEFLARNKRFAYPQKIFEAGKVAMLADKGETKVGEKNVLCVALSSGESDFTGIKSHLDSICRNLGIECRTKPAEHIAFAKGRCAEINAGSRKGIVGEVSKEVLYNFGIDMPVAVLEMEI